MLHGAHSGAGFLKSWHLVKKFPGLMENVHAFLNWIVPATEGRSDTVPCFFLMISCRPSIPQMQMLLLQKQQIFILFSDKIILVRLQFPFFAPGSCSISQWILLFLVYILSLHGGKWQSNTKCSLKPEKKVHSRVTDLNVNGTMSL
jgi:hypothetical protein